MIQSISNFFHSQPRDSLSLRRLRLPLPLLPLDDLLRLGALLRVGGARARGGGEDLLELAEVERAAAVGVPRREEVVDVLLRRVEAEERHRLVELLAAHLAVAGPETRGEVLEAREVALDELPVDEERRLAGRASEGGLWIIKSWNPKLKTPGITTQKIPTKKFRISANVGRAKQKTWETTKCFNQTPFQNTNTSNM